MCVLDWQGMERFGDNDSHVYEEVHLTHLKPLPRLEHLQRNWLSSQSAWSLGRIERNRAKRKESYIHVFGLRDHLI